MSDEETERILADFREWLRSAPAAEPPRSDLPEVSLNTLLAQFTALRHEINLQTKASRSTLEQNGEALTALQSAVEQLQEQPEEDDGLSPLLKAVVDVYDNLALALKQVTRQRDAIEKPLAEIVDGVTLPGIEVLFPDQTTAKSSPGIWTRLFGAQANAAAIGTNDRLMPMIRALQERTERTKSATSLLRSSLESLITGYRMSLARIDRVLEQYEMEEIATEGEQFDPELMEVVEVVADGDKPSGQVVEEVRRGYIRDEVVFRYAQVKVAK